MILFVCACVLVRVCAYVYVCVFEFARVCVSLVITHFSFRGLTRIVFWMDVFWMET